MNSWIAQMREPMSKIGHWIVVDGIDSAGRVLIRDPYHATKYLMKIPVFNIVD